MVNVVLICLDAVRKDIFDQQSTRLQELATYSFDNCRAASSWSVPSHASIFTGQLPSEHGAHSESMDFRSVPIDSVVTQEIDMETISVSANRFTSPDFGFDLWFDDCITVGRTQYFPSGADTRGLSNLQSLFKLARDDESPLATMANGAVAKSAKILDNCPFPTLLDGGTNRVANVALKEIESKTDYFLFTNFMEAHGPHRWVYGYDSSIADAPNSWSSNTLDYQKLNEEGLSEKHQSDVDNLRSIYKASVDYQDQVVSEFINKIEKISSKPTVTIITSDHGENLGYDVDDNLFGHSSSLSEGLLHVPLLIRDPSGIMDVESNTPISHLDIKDIIHNIINGDENRINRTQCYSEVIGGGLFDQKDEYWDRAIRSAHNFDNEEKYVWDSQGKIKKCRIDKSRSSWEFCREVTQIPDSIRNRFEMSINSIKKQEDGGPSEIGEDVRSNLEELGYL